MKTLVAVALFSAAGLLSSCGGESPADQNKEEQASELNGGAIRSWCVGNTIHYFNSTRRTDCGEGKMCREIITPNNGLMARCKRIPL